MRFRHKKSTQFFYVARDEDERSFRKKVIIKKVARCTIPKAVAGVMMMHEFPQFRVFFSLSYFFLMKNVPRRMLKTLFSGFAPLRARFFLELFALENGRRLFST
jgi:hypothetical protein